LVLGLGIMFRVSEIVANVVYVSITTTENYNVDRIRTVGVIRNATND